MHWETFPQEVSSNKMKGTIPNWHKESDTFNSTVFCMSLYSISKSLTFQQTNAIWAFPPLSPRHTWTAQPLLHCNFSSRTGMSPAIAAALWLQIPHRDNRSSPSQTEVSIDNKGLLISPFHSAFELVSDSFTSRKTQLLPFK